jgi:DNA-binding response OmpR family regulator
MKKRILLIDDSEVVRAKARDTLEMSGYQVITAANGLEANRYLFQKEKPDIIIIDVMIPILDGNRTAKLIKENENTRQIPIMLLSSKPEEELHRLTVESGADGFIQKPVDFGLLVEKIEETLRLRAPVSHGGIEA